MDEDYGDYATTYVWEVNNPRLPDCWLIREEMHRA